MRRCECGHPVTVHTGFFCDCLASCKGGHFCRCRGFVERAAWVVRVWRWLKAVPR